MQNAKKKHIILNFSKNIRYTRDSRDIARHVYFYLEDTGSRL